MYQKKISTRLHSEPTNSINSKLVRLRNTLILFISILVLIVLPVKAQTPGSIDVTFNPSDVGFGYGDGANGTVFSSALQNDGKIIIGGSFSKYNNFSANRIARLNADGTLDATFQTGTGFSNTVNSVCIQSDGKIIVVGLFNSYNSIPCSYIARLNSDGSFDNSFSTGWIIYSGFFTNVLASKIQADGKIVIGGVFNSSNGFSSSNIARLTSDGSEDPTFTAGSGPGGTPTSEPISVKCISIQADNKIIIGGNFTSYNGTAINRIARLTSSGILDNTFIIGTGFNSTVTCIHILSSGKLIIAGNFSTYNNLVRPNILRLNSNGIRDFTFSSYTWLPLVVYSIAIQSTGRIIMGYGGTITGGNSNIACFNADGSYVSGFPSTKAGVYSLLTLPDDKIIAGTSSAATSSYVNRLTSSGNIDFTFNNVGSGANIHVNESIVQSDGKIIISGSFNKYNNVPRNGIARIDADGNLDSTFHWDENYSIPGRLMALDHNGKLLITVDSGTSRILKRLNKDGTIDNTFYSNATETGSPISLIKIQADGKILIARNFSTSNGNYSNIIERLNADGSIDNGFKADAAIYNNGYAKSIAIQNNGKIIIAGFFAYEMGITKYNLARFNTDGSLDHSFDGVTSGINNASGINLKLLLQPDEKIFIVGDFSTYNEITSKGIVRVNNNGTFDNTFNVGSLISSGAIYDAELQHDGKVIIVGSAGLKYNGTTTQGIARINNDGTLDNTFSAGTGINSSSTIYTCSFQTNNNLIIAGTFTSYNGTGRNRIARLFTNASTPSCPTDINADGVTSQSDLSALLLKFGSTCMCTADVNSDGVVSQLDLSLLLLKFGEVCQ